MRKESRRSSTISTGLARRAVCLVTLLLAAASATAQDWRFMGVERVVAISDVHGAYDTMVRTLTNVDVIDDTLGWTAGSTHLVIVGDLLDRGADSRKVMDLVMRLELEAQEQGGRVHQLLGNHEVMNLVGDLRYVAPEEFAAFAADESAEEREMWYQRFEAGVVDSMDESEIREMFGTKAPPGFFAHRRAFREDGTYGAWLLRKPLMVVINDTAYVHGGVSPVIAELGLDGVNQRLSSELAEYVSLLGTLTDAGVVSPLDNFYSHDEVLEPLASDEEFAEAISSLKTLQQSVIHGSEGPLWYRGTVGCSALIESDRLDAALRKLRAERVVIGHTPTQTRRILQRLDGRVIEVDTGMLKSAYAGSGNALVIDGESIYAVNEASPERLSIREHPRRVGLRPASLTADDLERILAHGEIVAVRRDEQDRTIVDVSADGVTIRAGFSRNPRGRRFVPELAAYRLDRELGLDMVPVTVAREIDGRRGTLQFMSAGAPDEARRANLGLGASAWCPLGDQWAAMYVFDALIFNPGRSPQNMLYSGDNWQLMLVGHEEAFSTRRDRPRYLRDVELTIGDAWRKSLTELDDAALNELFDGVLDKRRIAAFASRRDGLLK